MKPWITGMSSMLLASLTLFAGAQAAVSLQVAPSSARLDQVVAIRASGLAPLHSYTFSLQTTDKRGIVWRSDATCRSSSTGVIQIATCAPTAGTYTGKDAMGMFWSMRPLNKSVSYFEGGAGKHSYDLQLRDGARTVAKQTILRSADDRLVSASNLPAPLVGTYFVPKNGGKHPAIIFLGGSEGGHSMDAVAQAFAMHGYVTVSLAYFGLPGLPQQLVEVPLETVGSALAFLQKRSDIDASHIGIIGMSKGAELALMASTYYRQIHGVVALVPSSAVFFGIDRANPRNVASSWSYQGKPLPYIQPDMQAAMQIGQEFMSHQPVSFAPYYRASLQNDSANAAARIAVEKIAGPVLLVSGDADAMWDSSPMSSQIMERLRAHRHPFADRWLHFAGAGHALWTMYSPTYGYDVIRWPGGGYVLGGTPAADARASERLWPRISAFFNNTLAGGHAQ